MKVISHRGYWRNIDDQNTLTSFSNSLSKGYGIETDIRDLDGDIVISHDLPRIKNKLFIDDFLDIYKTEEDYRDLWLALNIKSDGLSFELGAHIKDYDLKNYFIFDNSIPDLRTYLDLGIKFFTRQSEYESDLPFYSSASGVWLDCFEKDIEDEETILSHIKNNKLICLVSPELHGRDHLKFWNFIADFETDSIMLCTDYPDEAHSFFNE